MQPLRGIFRRALLNEEAGTFAHRIHHHPIKNILFYARARIILRRNHIKINKLIKNNNMLHRSG